MQPFCSLLKLPWRPEGMTRWQVSNTFSRSLTVRRCCRVEICGQFVSQMSSISSCQQTKQLFISKAVTVAPRQPRCRRRWSAEALHRADQQAARQWGFCSPCNTGLYVAHGQRTAEAEWVLCSPAALFLPVSSVYASAGGAGRGFTGGCTSE